MSKEVNFYLVARCLSCSSLSVDNPNPAICNKLINVRLDSFVAHLEAFIAADAVFAVVEQMGFELFDIVYWVSLLEPESLVAILNLSIN